MTDAKMIDVAVVSFGLSGVISCLPYFLCLLVSDSWWMMKMDDGSKRVIARNMMLLSADLSLSFLCLIG